MEPHQPEDTPPPPDRGEVVPPAPAAGPAAVTLGGASGLVAPAPTGPAPTAPPLSTPAAPDPDPAGPVQGGPGPSLGPPPTPFPAPGAAPAAGRVAPPPTMPGPAPWHAPSAVGPSPSGYQPPGRGVDAPPAGFTRAPIPPLPGYPAAPPPGPPGAFDETWTPAPGRGSATGEIRPRSSRTAVVVAAVAAAVLASVITAVVVLAIDRSSPTAAPTAGSAASLDIGGLLERTESSVVSIRTDETTTSGVYGGAGSGVVISSDGLVLTNAHVVDRAGSMTVTLFDGSIKPATLVGSFPDDDVALVKVEDVSGLTPAELGSSTDARVGDPVVAIGNALNLGGTPSVTEGIISAKDRTIDARNLTLRNLLQTDAAINEGNSGGPLLDRDGRVIGINTAIISDAQNIGFAIAIDEVKPLIDELEAGKGTITPNTAFLGVSTTTVDDVNASTKREYEVSATDGAFVSDLVKDSPAAKAGLEQGDVIVEIDGVEVAAPADVGKAVRDHEPGDSVTIVVERRGERRTVDAVLDARGR